LTQARTPVPASGAISGVVRDAITSAPIREARVCRVRGGAIRGSAPCQFADERGRFVLLDVPSGTYRLTATRPGYANAWYGGTSPKELSIQAGEWFRTAEVVLVPLGSISGTVFDEAGEPVVGAPVQALMPFQLAGLPHVAAGPRAVTDDRGSYRLPGLTPGRYSCPGSGRSRCASGS
jgi:hypothetical protein